MSQLNGNDAFDDVFSLMLSEANYFFLINPVISLATQHVDSEKHADVQGHKTLDYAPKPSLLLHATFQHRQLQLKLFLDKI